MLQTLAADVDRDSNTTPGTGRQFRRLLERPRILVIGWLAVVTIFNLLTLLSFPAPFVDEAWGANRAWALLQTGRAFGTMDQGVFQRFPGYWTYFPWLGTAIHAATIWAFGLSLSSMRLTSLIFGLILLVAIYTIARRLLGTKAGLLALLLTSVSPTFLRASHLGRDDIVVTALGFGAIALYLTDRSTGIPFQSVLCGLLVGLTLDIHPNGMIFGPAIAALYLYDRGPRLVRSIRFWGFATGSAAGVGFFVTKHLVAYPETYTALSRQFYGVWREPPLFVLDPSTWLQSIVGLGFVLVQSSDAKLVIVLIASYAFLRSGSKAERRLIVIFLALAFGFAALIRFKVTEYDVLIAPAADLVVAGYLCHLMAGPPLRSRSRMIKLTLIPLAGSLALALAVTIAGLASPGLSDYQTVVANLQATVAPGASVMGPQTYWFGLTDHSYLSLEQIAYFQSFTPGASVEDALRSLHPDYLILDRQSDQFVVADRATLPPFFTFLYVSKPGLVTFLSAHARLAREVKTTTYGDVS
ncbi:MAG: ArnT family glycosyltransferase, partial [Chloroflexota bacterium]